MSDAPEHPPKETDVERIRRYFDVRGFSHECPVCHTSGWTVIQDPVLESIIVFRLPSGSPSGQSAIFPVISTHCANCGYVRQFSRAAVDKYLGTLPRTGSASS
jgi:hypothetical protein